MPVYNEEAAIGGVLEKWVGALDRIGLDYVIRPYNDGSKDGSLAVMRAAAKRFPTVEVRDKANGGHGHTILTGYREAAADGFDWIFQVDSDDEMGPEKFEELWRSRSEKDFLVGIRDGRVQQLPRKIISLVSRLCVRLFYGRSVWDVNTPYRLMRVSAFANFYRSIPLTTFAPNVILSGLAAKHGLRMFETRVPQHDRTTGEVSIRKWKLLKAAVRSFAQTISYAFGVGLPLWWFVVAALTAVGIRFGFSMMAPTYDYDSYEIVADIVRRGGNVYAETERYNYAPVWFNILALLKTIFGSHLRTGLVLLLSAVDVGIAALLWRKRMSLGAFLFLFSPISAYVSGCHNQFDNFAVLVALCACLLLDAERKQGRNSVWPMLLIGFSLTIKHIFVFLPFWFLFETGTRLRKRLVKCALPLLIFALSFVPYIMQDAAFDGWVKNVILYRSQQNGLSWRLGAGACSMPIFVFGMVFAGFLLKERSWFERFTCYTVVLMLLTPAIADQYYAIPVVYCATHVDVFSLLYNFGFVRVLGWLTSGKGNGFVVLLLAISLLVQQRRASKRRK